MSAGAFATVETTVRATRPRTRDLIIFAVAVLLVLTVGVAHAQTPKRGGTLRVAVNSEPTNLDPHRSTAFITRVVLGSVVEGLYTLDEKYEPIPDLAERLEVSEDKLRYGITLRKGVKFHNGKEMTSADVVASLNRWLAISTPGKNLRPDVASVAAQAADRVELRFKRPIGQLVISALAFSYQFAAILPEEQVKEAGSDKVIKEPIGTGPFRIASVQPGRAIRLERFPDYASRNEPIRGYGGGKTAYLDAVVLYPTPEAAVRVSGLEAGNFDFVLNVSADSYDRLKANPLLQLFTPYSGSQDVVLNNKAGVLVDKRVRQAFLAALDMDLMLRAAYGNPAFYRTDAGLWPKETAWWTDAGKEHYNQKSPQKAKRLLAEAGYKGEPLRWLTTKENAGYYEMAVVAKQQLEQAGFKVDLQVLDFATVLSRRFDPNVWEVFQSGFSIQPDPTQYLVFDCKWPAFWCDARKNELLDQLTQELPVARRRALWQTLQRHYWEEVPAIKVGDSFFLYGASAKVSGYQSLNQVFWYNVWLK